jgi:hypothetical protein
VKTDWTEINKHRVREGLFGSEDSVGRFGQFQFTGINPQTSERTGFIVIASSGDHGESDWEHVSVRAVVLSRKGRAMRGRLLTWEEMCWIKGCFWEDEECVVQFHPPKSEYVNNHAEVLHLWKFKTGDFPRPPKILV